MTNAENHPIDAARAEAFGQRMVGVPNVRTRGDRLRTRSFAAAGTRRLAAVAAIVVSAVVVPASPSTATHATFERVSVSATGAEADGWSAHLGAPAISDDGRIVAFSSRATNLVPGDTNGVDDVFVRDRANGTTTRVSVASDGAQGDDAVSFFTGPALSGDGRYILFSARASNLVPDDTNGADDVFLHDRVTSRTSLVSATPSGTVGNGASGSAGIALSGDGRYAAFTSTASNLVDGDTGLQDIFVRDLVAGITAKATAAADGTAADGASSRPKLSWDGSVLAFHSSAKNLVPGDVNGRLDVFVWERRGSLTAVASRGTPGPIRRVSVASDGGETNGTNAAPGISADGQVVAFASTATNLDPRDPAPNHDIYVHDRATGVTDLISVGANGTSQLPALSRDGRFVGFQSSGTLTPCGRFRLEAYVHDRLTGSTALVSRAGSMGPWGSTSEPVLTPDAAHLAFASWTDDLVPGDTNGEKDVFVHELEPSVPTTIHCPNPTALREGDLVVAGAATPDAIVEVFDDEASLGRAVAGGYGAWQLRVALGEGRHPLRAVASTGERAATLLVVVDATPPDTAFTTPDGDVQPSIPGVTSVTLSGTAEDGPSGSGAVAVHLRFTPVVPPSSALNNGFVAVVPASSTWQWQGELNTGEWRITAKAIDRVGLSDPEPAAIALYVVP